MGMKSIDIKLLPVIWQVLASHIGNGVTEKICQDIIKYIKTNQQVSQDLIFAIYKSFYGAQNTIASKCREELIKKSIMTLYRGVIDYQPPENDSDIKYLEHKIQSLNFHLKEIHKIKLNNRQAVTFNQIEELLTQLSSLNYQSFQKTEEYLGKLIKEVEKDCDVNIYKTTLRDRENGLRKALYEIFLTEIEDNDGLKNIFDANSLTFKYINTIRTDDSQHHILGELDGKLFIAPLEPIPIESGISWEELGREEKAAHDIQDNENTAEKLKDLASHLSPELLEQAFYAARDIESDLWRSKKLGELAPQLPPKMLEQALEAVCEIESDLWRAQAMGELAPYLPPKLLKQAFYAVRDIESELWRAKALGELAPHLPPKLLKQALEAAHSIQSDYSRARALQDLEAHLS